jgi:phenylacetate-CoA ligase
VLPFICGTQSQHSVPEWSLRLFETAKRDVSAYTRVLAESGLDSFMPSSVKDWKRLPLIDKDTYINRFPPEALFSSGRISAAAHASSGSSGSATFWFRGRKHKRWASPTILV